MSMKRKALIILIALLLLTVLAVSGAQAVEVRSTGDVLMQNAKTAQTANAQKDAHFKSGYVQLKAGVKVYATAAADTLAGKFTAKSVAWAEIEKTAKDPQKDWLKITFDTAKAKKKDAEFVTGYVRYADVTALSKDKVKEIEADKALRKYGKHPLPEAKFQAAKLDGPATVSVAALPPQDVPQDELPEEAETSAEGELIEKLAKLKLTVSQSGKTGIGSKVKLKVTVKNASGTVKYQWQVSTNKGKTWKSVSGGKKATLTVKVKEETYTSQYRCLVTTTKGQRSYSKQVKIAKPFTLKVTPSKQTYAAKTLKFTAKATKTKGTVKYEWQKSTNGGKTWKKAKMSGYKTKTLKITKPAKYLNTQFRCKVTDKNGTLYTKAVYIELKGTNKYKFEKDTSKSWTVTKYKGNEENVSIPAYHMGMNVTRIGAGAFKKNKYVENVSVPNTVKNIDDEAFSGCKELTDIYIPKSVVWIGFDVFKGGNDDLYVTLERNTYAKEYCMDNGISYAYPIKAGSTIDGLKSTGTNFTTVGSNDVTFTATSDNDITFALYDQEKGNRIGRMRDDGKWGDAEAGDGVYTLKTDVAFSTACARNYYAGNGSVRSKAIALYFYDRAADPQEAEQTLATINHELEESGDAAADTPEAKLAAVEQTMSDMLASGDILAYNTSDTSVFGKTKYGVTIAYVPEVPGADAGDDEPVRIYTFQPSRSGYSGLDAYMAYPSDAATLVESTFGDFSYAGWYNDSAATLERIRELGPDSVVLWHGHAGYSDTLGPTMVTGDEFDYEALTDADENNPYLEDCWDENIIMTSDGKVMISAGYIAKHCGRLDNSLIYLGTCASGKGNRMYDAFLNKGAAAVVANTGVLIDTKYNLSMMKAVLTGMCDINVETGNYYTVGEALAKAYETVGENDSAMSGGSHDPSKPVLHGADDYRFGTYTDIGSLRGRVISATTQEPVAGAVIELSKDGKVLRTSQTDANGEYQIDDLLPTTYMVRASADNYVSCESYAGILRDETTEMETFMLVEGQEGQTGMASGTITNAFTGAGLADVTLTIRSGWNNTENGEAAATLTTSEEGFYATDWLPIGNYTVATAKSGFMSSYFNIIVLPNQDYGSQDHAVMPETDGGQFRFRLTWGEQPYDLDAHLVAFKMGEDEKEEQYHVYYFNKEGQNDEGDTVCVLDVDDYDSFGPEVITMDLDKTYTYYFFVNNYSAMQADEEAEEAEEEEETGDETADEGERGVRRVGKLPAKKQVIRLDDRETVVPLTESGAKVEVYFNDILIRTFNISPSWEPKLYWNVFAIKNGRIIVKNTMSDEENTSY